MSGRMKLTIILMAAVVCTGIGCSGNRKPDPGELRRELNDLDKADGLSGPSNVQDA